MAGLFRLDGPNIETWLECDELMGTSFDFTTSSADYGERRCNESNGIIYYYLYNVTNAEQVIETGQLPIVDEIGPFSFNIRVRKSLKRHSDGWAQVYRQKYYEYIGEEQDLDLEITTINLGLIETFTRFKDSLGFKEDYDVALVCWVIVNGLQRHVFGSQATNASDWVEQKDDPDCLTYGCFLFQNKFSKVYAETSSTDELTAFYTGHTLLDYPVFDSDPLSTSQAQLVWDILQPGTSFIQDESVVGYPAQCAFTSTLACGKLGAAVSNIKNIVDAFLMLWVFSGNGQTVLNAVDFVRLETAKESGDLTDFSDELWGRDYRCEAATTFSGELRCTQLNDLMQYFHWIFTKEWTEKYFTTRNPAHGLWTTQTARQHLLTGFEDSSLILFNKGMDSLSTHDSSRNTLYADLFEIISGPNS